MRKIVLTEWISLDGFTSGPENDMTYVGQFFGPEMGKYESDILDTADIIMIGRETYESFSTAWPNRETDPDTDPAERDYAKRLNSKKKIVYSKSMEKAEWNNSELKHEINAEEIQKLKAEEGKDILIYGSASIVQQLTDLGLIDEYQLLIHPILLGGGKSLFKDIKPKTIKFSSSKAMQNGVLLVTYNSTSP